MNNTISVIVPAFNIEAYLPRCLDSILSQTYEHLEVVVVNDGSRDNTAGVIDSYAVRDSRIKAIHKENGGVTSARLRGIAESTGDWIAFVDGDDYIEPEMFEKLLANAESYNADISHCGYRMVFPDHTDWYYNTGKLTPQPGAQGVYDLLESKFVEPGLVCKLFRRDLFAGLDAWMDRSIRINEDLLMNAYLFRKSKMAVHEDVCPYHYILRKGSTMISQFNEYKMKDPGRVVDILLREETDPLARDILTSRLADKLIGGATQELGTQKELIYPWRKECRKRLRELVPLKGAYHSKRIRVLSLWAAIWPWSYCIVHKVYARLRGTDRKYEVK